MQLGLTLPQPGAAPTQPQQGPSAISIGGIMSAQSLSSVMAQEQAAAAAEEAARAANQPVVQGLVQMLQNHWSNAKTAKLQIEQDMLEAVRAKAGRYSQQMESSLQQQGGSQIYMMLFATKARQAKALLADVLIGSGAERPWTVNPSPKPDIPEETKIQFIQGMQQAVAQAEMQGQPMDMPAVVQLMRDAKERLENFIVQKARDEADTCAVELDDALTEGNFLEALDEFLDDLTTFKTAFIKGPVVYKKPELKWTPGPDGASEPEVVYVNKLNWERVDPFMIYPVSWAKNCQDAPLFERHKLTRGDLNELIGVDGYNEAAIRSVLDKHGAGGLHDWLMIDTAKANAENRSTAAVMVSETIDALQYWGSASGKMLREWGMEGVKDDAKEYQVEIWQIGEDVIKCVINQDPLGRRPYYMDGYSRIPGAFWNNCLYDLIKDVCDMCNSAARALSNNMGLSSGPQVGVNIDRIAPGEDVTQMFPWKIWQFNHDPLGSSAPPIQFFQPQSNAAELMGVYDKFSLLADEYSGIPRYMTGTEGTPGAGRTASGLSMMVGNASKVIKSLVGSIDKRVIGPVLKRLFDWKMQYDKEFAYKGDLQIVPRGALSLQVKEAANQARMQFLQMTTNPLDMQIMGVQGRAALLREAAKNLDMNTDDVVPSLTTLRMRMIEQSQQQAGEQPQPQQQAAQKPPARPNPSGQALMDGRPTTDHFSPQGA